MTPLGMAAAMAWQFTIRLHCSADELRMARRMAAAAATEAGADQAAVLEVEVAVGEAVANAFMHAYGGRRRGALEVDLAFDGQDLEVAVHDGGKPVTAAMAVPTELPAPGAGRGLYLIGRLMDEVRVIHPNRRGRGTAIRMRKRVRGGPEGDGADRREGV